MKKNYCWSLLISILLQYYLETVLLIEIKKDSKCNNWKEQCEKFCSWIDSNGNYADCNLICIRKLLTFNRSTIKQLYERNLRITNTVDNTIRNNNDQMIMVNDKDYEDNVDNLTIPIVGFVESQQKGSADNEAKIFQKQTDWMNQENGNSKLFKRSSQFNQLLGLKNRNEKLTNSSMKQGYQYQEHQNHKFGLSIEGIITNVISNVIQHDKQFEKGQQQHELIHDRKRRQKRFPEEKSEKTEWFQWPGPCNDDNHCPPNLYCVNGSCWHLLNKPIRIQQIHAIKEKEQTRSDISHLMIHHSLHHSVDDDAFTTTRERLITNLSEFRNSVTDTTITTVIISTTTTTAFHQTSTETKSKTTSSNHQKKRQQLITTTNSQLQTATYELDVLPKSSSINSRFPSKLPISTEYTQQRRFGRPIRIELYLARAVLQDECSQDSHCGHRMICCRKRWYDLSADSGIGYFCLPDCELTKKVSLGIHEANGLIPNDIIYD